MFSTTAPRANICGRGKQMGAHYETRFRDLIAGENWHLKRHEFANELCFVSSA